MSEHLNAVPVQAETSGLSGSPFNSEPIGEARKSNTRTPSEGGTKPESRLRHPEKGTDSRGGVQIFQRVP
jgi:hypothetical protein